MNLQNQVVSLNLAKRLKELGVEQDSLFYWADDVVVIGIDIDLLLDNNKSRTLSGMNNSWPDHEHNLVCSAFTASELLELIPSTIEKTVCNYYLCIKWIEEVHTNLRRYYLNYKNIHDDLLISIHNEHLIEDINMANAIAKMLIHLLKNNLLPKD